jgi:hypothetical protein
VIYRRGGNLTARDAPEANAETRPRDYKLAARRLARGRLKPKPGISRSQVTAALAKALAITVPGSSHGRLLAAALAPVAENPRPATEVAVRLLLARGQVPTAAGVAGQVVAYDQRKAAMAARERRRKALRAPDSSDGPRAAMLVAEHWRAHGHGPTWRALGRAMGWSSQEVGSIVRGFAKAGWLSLGDEPRSLRPGPHLRRGPTP